MTPRAVIRRPTTVKLCLVKLRLVTSNLVMLSLVTSSLATLALLPGSLAGHAWVKTAGISAAALPSIFVIGVDAQGSSTAWRSQSILDVAPTQDWTKFDLIVNSGANPSLRLYLGGSFLQGTLWFDEVVVEEAGFVNLVRRTQRSSLANVAGTPTVLSPSH